MLAQHTQANKQQVVNKERSDAATASPADGCSSAAPSSSELRADCKAEPRAPVEDPYVPGYSVIRERAVDRLAANETPPCSCTDHDHDERRADSEEGPAHKSSQRQQTKQRQQQQQQVDQLQQVAPKAPSMFRQLLGHLGDAQRSKTPVQDQQTKPKSSWLKSRFSLSSSNLAAAARDPDTSEEADSRAGDKESVSSSGRRVENGESERQARPKSAVSQSNADLIAAQKSLAAAAAAKVKRDRLFKMSLGGQPSAHHVSPPMPATSQAASSGVLTVKTSEPNFWPHHHQPLVLPVGNQASKYMIGPHSLMMNSGHQRSGTNSVGMSDSSPSNNGAESDNSIQTTTGSLNTDNASSGTAAEQNLTPEQTASPLGILSRILLNNKGLGALRATGQKSQNAIGTDGQKEQAADSSGSTTLRNGSISSSSALSSPRSDGKQPAGAKLLDQLSSRSRCPIVLSKSNELPAGDDTLCPGESAAEQAPRLPAKSSLKPHCNLLREQSVLQPITAAEPLNGLPRVASYTQISANGVDVVARQQSLCNYHAVSSHQYPMQYNHHYSLYPNSNGNHHLAFGQQPPLVSGPYQPQHHLSHHDLRSIGANVDFSQLPASAINYEYYLDAPNYHLNYRPLANGYLAENPANLYVANPLHGADESIYISSVKSSNSNNHHHLVRDTVMQHRGPDSALVQTGRADRELLIGSKRPQHHHHLHNPYSDSLYQNQQFADDGASKLTISQIRNQQQRPKSSLDTILFSSRHLTTTNSANSTNSPLDRAANCLGRPHRDDDDDWRDEQVMQNASASKQADRSSSSLHHQHKRPLPTYYIASTQASLSRRQQQQQQAPAAHQPAPTNRANLYSDNSIYASDQSTTSFNQHSDLTVLPTGATDNESGRAGQSTFADDAAAHQQSQSSSGSTSPALVVSADDKKLVTEIATSADQLVSGEQEGAAKRVENSWKSTAPNNYRSLVQVNQSPSSNQSLSINQVAGICDSDKVMTVQVDTTTSVTNDKRSTPTTSDNGFQSPRLLTNGNKTSSFAAIAKQQVVISCPTNKVLHLSDDFSGSTIL